MTILVIAEHDNKVLAPATLNTVAAAAKVNPLKASKRAAKGGR